MAEYKILGKVEKPNPVYKIQGKAEEMPSTEEDVGAYLDQLPPPEGFFSKLPRNIAIGLAKGGHSTINLPHDLVANAENKLSDFSKKLEEAANFKLSPKYNHAKPSDYIYEQPNYDFASMLGQKNAPTLMDKIIQGGVQYAPEILGGGGLARAGFRRLKGTHQLDAAERAAQEFGGNNFSYSPGLVKEAKKYMPNTEATRQLISKSVAGEYPASFGIRSQLGKHQRDLEKSLLPADRLLAPELGDLRQKMIAELDQGLRNQGMHVEADMLRKGIKNYHQYMRVKEAIMPVVKKLGIPLSGGALLGAAIGYGYKKGKQFVKD